MRGQRLGPPLLLDLLSVGSVFFSPIENFMSSSMSDATFTGRTVIWKFTAENILKHPNFGLFGLRFRTRLPAV